MQHALAAGMLAALACGVIGPLVVVNRLVFLAGGVAHAAFGGIGLAFYFGFAPTAGALSFSLVSAMVMGSITSGRRQRSDTIVGVLWAVGMALGVVLIDLTPGYNVDLMSYLFGSILAVPASDLPVMAALDLLIVLVIGLFYRHYLAISYDEEFARVAGVPVRLLYFVLLALIAVSVVMLIRIVGLVLVIALLTIPAYMAEQRTGSLWTMMMVSAALAMVFTIAGLALAVAANLSSGASIILVAAGCFFLDLVVTRLRQGMGRPSGAAAEPKASIRSGRRRDQAQTAGEDRHVSSM